MISKFFVARIRYWIYTLHYQWWSLYKLLTIIWSDFCSGDYTNQHTVKWINLWARGTFTTMHYITYKLITQPYFLFFIEGFGLCMVEFTMAMRSRWWSPSAPLPVHSEMLSLRARVVKFTACDWIDSCNQTLLCVRVVLHCQ